MKIANAAEQIDSDILPVRRRLPHTPPARVSQYAHGAEFFITVCVNRAQYGIPPADAGRRGPLADEPLAAAILDSIEYRREIGEWHPHIALVMPDHLHFIATFAQSVSMAKSIASWKRFLATKYGIAWQDGFFDHRLRNDIERAEKWHYIETNPVANGLCAKPEDWPYRRVWQRAG